MAILRVLIIALVGALSFSVLGLPIPWMLGPLFAVLVSQFFIKSELTWPPIFRNIGLLVVGVAIGQAFELSLFERAGQLVVSMFIINIVLMVFCFALAWLSAKMAGLPFKTAVASSVPGGLSQLVLFAEEERDVDLAVVTYFHVVRVVAVVMLIPFFVSGHVVSGAEVALGVAWWQLVLLVACAAVAVPIAKRIHLPVPHFLGPILFVIVLKLFAVEVPVMPSDVLHGAQLLIGAYIGLLLKPEMVRLPTRVLAGGVVNTLLMIGFSYGASVVVGELLGFRFATSFLSTAPGGLDQMGLLAAAVSADISVVTVFQLFRLLFIFLVVLPLLKWYYQR